MKLDALRCILVQSEQTLPLLSTDTILLGEHAPDPPSGDHAPLRSAWSQPVHHSTPTLKFVPTPMQIVLCQWMNHCISMHLSSGIAESYVFHLSSLSSMLITCNQRNILLHSYPNCVLVNIPYIWKLRVVRFSHFIITLLWTGNNYIPRNSRWLMT